MHTGQLVLPQRSEISNFDRCHGLRSSDYHAEKTVTNRIYLVKMSLH